MIAVIGDIHGCFNTLKELLEKINKNYNNIPLYCVGDLVDRGKFSFEVMELVKEKKIVFTPGNHDYMFYYFIKFPTSQIGRTWIYNGYESTISSYDNRFDKVSEHLELVEKAPLFINLDDCFISHAGISKYYKSKLPKNYKEDLNLIEPVVCSDLTSEHSILWTRDELLNIGKLQLVGHTRQEEVNYQQKNNVGYIDTSVYTGHKLSAVIVEKNKIINIISAPTSPQDIE